MAAVMLGSVALAALGASLVAVESGRAPIPGLVRGRVFLNGYVVELDVPPHHCTGTVVVRSHRQSTVTVMCWPTSNAG